MHNWEARLRRGLIDVIIVIIVIMIVPRLLAQQNDTLQEPAVGQTLRDECAETGANCAQIKQCCKGTDDNPNPPDSGTSSLCTYDRQINTLNN